MEWEYKEAGNTQLSTTTLELFLSKSAGVKGIDL